MVKMKEYKNGLRLVVTTVPTVRSVAAGCGVAVGTVYNYFSSKDMLIAAFMLEMDGQTVPFGLFTPEETVMSHTMATAALKSHYNKTVEVLD